MKTSIVFCLVILIAVQFLGSNGEEFECEPGVLYKENDCNTCLCSRNHMLACTPKRCIYEWRFTLYNCEPGTTYTDECNKCWCVEGFGTVCTNRKCA